MGEEGVTHLRKCGCNSEERVTLGESHCSSTETKCSGRTTKTNASDYRALNKLFPSVQETHSNAKGVLSLVPLPKIDDIYARLKGARVFSALDFRSGYHHVELTPEARPRMAFTLRPIWVSGNL